MWSFFNQFEFGRVLVYKPQGFFGHWIIYMWLWYCNLLKLVPLQSTFGFSIKSLFAFFGHVLRLLTKIQKVTARFYFRDKKLHTLKVSWWKNYPPRACIIIWNMFVVCIEYILYLATGTCPKRARKYGEPSNSNCYYALFENVKSTIKWLIFFFGLYVAFGWCIKI